MTVDIGRDPPHGHTPAPACPVDGPVDPLGVLPVRTRQRPLLAIPQKSPDVGNPHEKTGWAAVSLGISSPVHSISGINATHPAL